MDAPGGGGGGRSGGSSIPQGQQRGDEGRRRAGRSDSRGRGGGTWLESRSGGGCGLRCGHRPCPSQPAASSIGSVVRAPAAKTGAATGAASEAATISAFAFSITAAAARGGERRQGGMGLPGRTSSWVVRCSRCTRDTHGAGVASAHSLSWRCGCSRRACGQPDRLGRRRDQPRWQLGGGGWQRRRRWRRVALSRRWTLAAPRLSAARHRCRHRCRCIRWGVDGRGRVGEWPHDCGVPARRAPPIARRRHQLEGGGRRHAPGNGFDAAGGGGGGGGMGGRRLCGRV